MTTSEATFYDLSLSSDQGLRYSLAAMLIKTHMPAGAIPEAAQALFDFVKGDVAAKRVVDEAWGSGYFAPVHKAGATFFVDGSAGQTQQLRQEDQSRG